MNAYCENKATRFAVFRDHFQAIAAGNNMLNIAINMMIHWDSLLSNVKVSLSTVPLALRQFLAIEIKRVFMDPSGIQVISTREAADRLGVSVRTIQLWVESGILEAWKTPGGHRRIPLDSVLDMLQKRSRSRQQLSDGHKPYPAQDKDTLRVLVVEDDPHLQEIYKLGISGLPFKVELETAFDGFSGLIRAGRMRPHVIIADLMLPGMDGFRMIRSLLDTPETANIKIYVISALTSAEIVERGGLPEQVQSFVKPAPLALVMRLLSDEFKKISVHASGTSSAVPPLNES